MNYYLYLSMRCLYFIKRKFKYFIKMKFEYFIRKVFIIKIYLFNYFIKFKLIFKINFKEIQIKKLFFFNLDSSLPPMTIILLHS